MPTAEEGGPTANNTSSAYGGGGAGGKLRKKTSRRHPTPYERPPIAAPTANSNASSWLTKLVVDPTSKLIAYGAERFLPSVFRKRLPLPPRPPPQTPDVNEDVIDEFQEEIFNNQESGQQPADGESSQPVNSSRSNSISEIEQLFKRKTFSRPEIAHLTELLHSRVAEESLGNDSRKDEKDNTSCFGRQEQFANGLLEENRSEGAVPSAIISTPLPISKVLEDEMASPAELAKAYMGSRPSKVSPSALRARHQVGIEDPGLLGNRQFASKTPIMSLISKTSIGQAASDNDFRTPRSRGRSAIYNMARTPFSGVRPTSVLKGSRTGGDDNARPSMASSSLSLMENFEKFPSSALTLKRRSSDMDDEHGSVGPIRRIRQKSNLLAPRIHHTSHGVGNGSHAKQKLQSIGKPGHKALVGESDNDSVPCSNYLRVPSKSSEVAARILQHLENLTPKEKSPVSKLTHAREKSPLKLTPGMHSAQALRNTKDVAPLKLIDGHESGDMPNATLPDTCNSSPQKPSMVAENGKNLPSDTWNPATKNDHVVPFRSSRSSINNTDPVVENGASIPPQRRRPFKMCAQEDTLELDDDLHHNGIQPVLFSEKTQTTEVSPAISSVVNFPASEVASKVTESALFPPSAAKFDKPKEASSPALLADRFPSLPDVLGKKAESNVESSKSLVNISASAASQVKIPVLGNVGHLNHMAGPDTAKGRVFSSVSNLNPAGNIGNDSSNTSVSIFGLSKPLNSVGGPFIKFGSSVDPATAVSTESTPTTPEIVRHRTEVELNPRSGSSSSLHSSVNMVAATNSGGSSFGLGSFTSHSTSNNLQGSFAVNASKTLVSDSGTSLGSVPSVAPASSLSFGINSTTSGSSFGFGSSSSLGTSTVLPGSEPTSVSFKFGASPAVSEANAISASTGATPGIHGFGFSSSSASTNTVGPSSGVTLSKFGFGGTSTATASVTSASSFSSSTSGIFSFGLNSSTSSSTVVSPVSSNTAPSSSLQSPMPSALGASSVFSFGAPSSSSAPAISPSTSAGFSFGAPSSSAPAISPSASTGLSFGAPSSSSALAVLPSTGFSFGASSAPATNSFGLSSSSPAGAPATGFSFGASSSSSTSAPAVLPSTSTGFSFSASSAPATTSFGLSSSSAGAPATGFSFGASSSSSSAPAVSPSTSTGFSFGASSATATTSFGLSSSSAGAPATGFSFGASSSSAPAVSPSTSTGFSFGASSTPATSLGLPPSSSAGAPATGFSFGAPSTQSAPAAASLPSVFSFGASSTPATSGFSFGASSTQSTAANASSVMFNSSAGVSPNPFFSSTNPSTPVFPSPHLPNSQPAFGSSPIGGFTASPGNNDQMMAEGQVEPSATSTATFGQQPSISPSPLGFGFGSTTPSQPNPFMFAGQQNQAAPAPNPSPFQASGQFNAGGSFSLGSGGGGGGDKLGRKIVKASRTKNRKK